MKSNTKWGLVVKLIIFIAIVVAINFIVNNLLVDDVNDIYLNQLNGGDRGFEDMRMISSLIRLKNWGYALLAFIMFVGDFVDFARKQYYKIISKKEND